MDWTQIIIAIAGGSGLVATIVTAIVTALISARKSQFEELRQLYELQQERLTGLEEKLEKKDAEIEELTARIRQLESENKRLRAVIDEYGIDIKKGRHKGLLVND